LVFSWASKWPGSDWSIANCDIGQGDASVINLGHHRAIVIDAGPDPELADRCLSSLGVKEIRLLIITHFHADHIGGISGALRKRKIDEVWANTADPITAGLPLRIVKAGYHQRIGNIDLDILWPQSANERNSNLNNLSVATLIRSPDFSLFEAGDMEPLTQSEIADSLPRVDIYKVCHHGSKYQDPAFTRALSPAIAMISVGAGNSYGHPATQTIAALVRLGARVVRTDTEGAIAISAQGHHFRIRTSRNSFTFFSFG
jgi:competence protein ComEC